MYHYVSEEFTAFTIRLHGAASQKMAIFKLVSTKTSNVTKYEILTVLPCGLVGREWKCIQSLSAEVT
jgi:hypothetical protein